MIYFELGAAAAYQCTINVCDDEGLGVVYWFIVVAIVDVCCGVCVFSQSYR